MGKIYEAWETFRGVSEVMDKITFSSDVIKLVHDPKQQDPELMLTDRERLGEFIDAYETIDFSDEGRFTLMFVILDTFMEAMCVSNAMFRDSFGYKWMLHQVHREVSFEERSRWFEEQKEKG